MKSHKLHWPVFCTFFASFVPENTKKQCDIKLIQQHNFHYVVLFLFLPCNIISIMLYVYNAAKDLYKGVKRR